MRDSAKPGRFLAVMFAVDAAALAVFWHLLPSLRRPLDVLLIATIVLGIATAVAGGRWTRNFAMVVISLAACFLAVEMGQKYFRFLSRSAAAPAMGTAGPYDWPASDGPKYLEARKAAIAAGDYPREITERYAGDIFAGMEERIAYRGHIVENETTKTMAAFYRLRDESAPNGFTLTANNLMRHHSFVTATGETLFDGRYTINSHGFRHTPGATEGDDVVIFMGCSQTFGFGLSDDETLAYYYGEAGGFSERVLNISVPNSGPHQALRELELEYLIGKAGVRPEQVRAVVYVLIDSHPERVVRSKYPYAPFYRLKGDTAEYVGTFAEADRLDKLGTLLRRSRAWPVLEQLLNYGRTDTANWRLTHAVLKRMHEICRERYGVGLTVFYQSGNHEISERMQQNGIRVIPMKDALGEDWGKSALWYCLYDGHSSAYANSLIGRTIYRTLHPATAE